MRDERNRPILPGLDFSRLLWLVSASFDGPCQRPAAASDGSRCPLEPPPLASDDGPDSSGLVKVPLAKPRPAQGPGSVDSFVDSLRGNDATFKVLVNQARILNLKQDITAGPNQALIAVGDPTILDFTVVNPRQLRLIGRGVGVTDLAITTARNRDLYLRNPRARRPDPDPGQTSGDLSRRQRQAEPDPGPLRGRRRGPRPGPDPPDHPDHQRLPRLGLHRAGPDRHGWADKTGLGSPGRSRARGRRLRPAPRVRWSTWARAADATRRCRVRRDSCPGPQFSPAPGHR